MADSALPVPVSPVRGVTSTERDNYLPLLRLQREINEPIRKLAVTRAWRLSICFFTLTLPRISHLERKTNDWVRSKINFLVGSQEPLLTTVKRRKLHGLGMLDAKTASPKPFFRAPWRASDAVVGRGNAGWTTSKSGHICPCQNCSQGPPAEKTWRWSLLNRSSCSPHDPIG